MKPRATPIVSRSLRAFQWAEPQNRPFATGTSGLSGDALIGEPRLLASEFECQAGDDEGREKERQKPLAGASEGDDFALGGVEGLSSA